MTNWIKNQIENLYNPVSAPMAATPEGLAERLQRVRETPSLLYDTITGNIEHERETLKYIVDKEAKEQERETTEQQEEQTEDNIDLTATKNKRALKGAYRSFVMPRIPKADIDECVYQVKPYIKVLNKDQLKEMHLSR